MTLKLSLFQEKENGLDNADVVTTFLIAKKRNPNSEPEVNRTISFCTLKESIEAPLTSNS